MYANFKTYSGGSPLPVAYDTTPQSLLIANSPSAGIVFIINMTSSIVAACVQLVKGGQAPSSTFPGRHFFVPAAPTGGSGVIAIDRLKVTHGDSLFVMTMNSVALTSGGIYVWVI